MGLEVEQDEGGQDGWGTDELGRGPSPVVAIGASAAAPEGLETLLRNLDVSGMAVALVVRGTDGDRSAMSARLRERLGDKLVEIADGTVIDRVPSAAVFDATFGAASTRRAEPPSQPPIESRPVQSLQHYADRKVLSGGRIADGADGPVALVAIDEQPRGG